MAKIAEQKTRLLTLVDILRRETDETHPLTVAQICAQLAAAGIDVERKTVLSDLRALEDHGYNIVNRRGRNGGCFLATREFELAELKLLTDVVASLRFLSARRRDALVRKLCRLTSRYEAAELARQVLIDGHVTREREALLYTIYTIYLAISEKCKITFVYPDETGAVAVCRISPWKLMLNTGEYYLVGYDEACGGMNSFRVDRIEDASLLEEHRIGEDMMEHFSSACIAGPFGADEGEETLVTLRCDETLREDVRDRFGTQVSLREADETHFLVTVRVRVCRAFIGWVLGYGARLHVTEPAHVAEQVRATAQEALNKF